MTDEHNDAFRPKKLTIKDIREGCLTLTKGDAEETRICVINEELRQGIDFVDDFPRSVSIFGSARTPEENEYYQLARSVANKIVTDLGYAVLTGGGPGMMQAGNHGAHDAGGTSLGLTIKLPMEQSTNPYVTDEIPFYYFFTRKVSLTYAAEAYIYMPGGFGTMDELFEILTLVQTGKITNVPVILVGKKFWEPLDVFIKSTLRDEFQTISPEDIDLYTITDDPNEVVEIVKNAPVRDRG